MVIASSVIAVLAIEGALWLFHLPPYPEGQYNVLEPDKANGFRFRPNSSSFRSAWEYDVPVHINSIGIRDYNSINAKSKPFAFLLGDSFVEGQGVKIDQTIAKRLQLLSGKIVANLGMQSIGTIQEVNIFKRYLNIFTHKPKYAILVFYTGNDYYDNRRYIDNMAATGHAPQTSSNGYLVDNGYYITENGSMLILHTKDGKIVREVKKTQFYPPKGWKNKYLDWSKLYNAFAWAIAPRNKKCQVPDATFGLRDKRDISSSEEWYVTKKALVDFVKTARSNSIIPILVIIPSKYQINKKLLEEAGCNVSEFYPKKSVAILDKFAQTNKIKNIDLYKLFSTLPPEKLKKLYYSVDTHLTPWGDNFVATALYKSLGWN